MSTKAIPNLSEAFIKRFWNKYKLLDTGCWEWQGYKCKNYGYIKINNKKFMVHRIAFYLHNRYIDDGKPVNHCCVDSITGKRSDNKLCINPSHLYQGTLSDNTKDAVDCGKLGKINYKIADIIRDEYNKGNVSSRYLGSKYNLSHSTILSILSRTSWTTSRENLPLNVYRTGNKRFRVRIIRQGKSICLGSYDTIEEAELVAINKREEIDGKSNDSNSNKIQEGKDS